MSPKATGLLVGARTTAGASVSVQARTGAGVAAGAPVTGTANTVGDVFVTVGGLTAGGVYYADVVVVSAGTPISPVTVTGKVTVGAGNGAGDFVPVGPIRSYDYRDTGAGGPWASGATRTVRVSGVAGVPTSGVSAVAVAISVVAPTAAGFITVWPSTSTKPLSTAVNFVAGQTKTNLVKVPVDSSGTMSIYNFTGTTGITVDVVGYYIDDTTTFTHAVSFQAVTPVRALDTRPLNGATNRRLTGGNTITTTVTGTTLNVPTTATAVEIQVEAIDPAAAGYLTVWATGTPQPIVSNVLYGNHQTIVTSAIAPIGTNGQITIYSNVTTDIAIDIAGYYDPTAGGKFHAINTTRLYDTRQPSLTKLNQDENRTIPLATGTPIPTNATAVVFAATAVNNTSPSYLTFWPGNQCKPLAAMLLPNAPNQLTDNLIVTGLGNQTTGAYNFLGQTDLVIDANGYYTGGTPAPAQPCPGTPTDTGTVTGKATISNATTPAPGVTVIAFKPDNTTAATTTTSTTGSYTLTLPPGDYRICFDGSTATTPTTGLVSECSFGGQFGPGLTPPDWAGAVTVTKATTTTANVVLDPGGAITGRVTSDVNGVGLAGVTVVLAYNWGGGIGRGTVSLSAGASAADEAGRFVTAADGTFTAKGLDQWATVVCFDGSTATNGPAPGLYLPECYDDVPLTAQSWGYEYSGAQSFGPAPGSTVTVNAGLWSGASLAGQVTNAAGQGLAGVTVTATSGQTRWSATSAADGSYLIKGIAAGRYTVCFDATSVTTGSTTGYLSECYIDVAWDPAQEWPVATPVPVSSTAVTGINATLGAGGSIAGKVTAPTGVGISNVRVRVRSSSGVDREVSTGADGSYRIVGLPATAYTVCVDAREATAVGFPGGVVSKCLADVPFVFYGEPRADAARTPVTLGATATVNVQLAPLGVISGTISGPIPPAPIGLSIVVWDANGAQAGNAWRGSLGTYTVTGLPLPGTYYVCFEDAADVFVDECHSDAPWSSSGPPAGATAVSLTTSATSATVNAALALAPAKPVFGITGTVTDAAGAPLPDVSANVYTGAGSYVNGTYTDTTGRYLIDSAISAGGAYYVCFGSTWSTTLVPECHNNVTWTGETPLPAGLTAVTVPPVGSRATVNAVMAAPPTITGKVTAAVGGAGLGNILVAAFAVGAPTRLRSATTAADGTYSLTVLPGTSYRICFEAEPGDASAASTSTGYLSECHNNVPYDGGTIPAGTTAVPAGATGINAQLAAAGSISGRVTNAAGAGIPFVTVSVLSPTGDEIITASTNWDGRYRVVGLSATPVVVCFHPQASGTSATGYRPECHNDIAAPASMWSAPPAGVTTVTPTLGSTTTVNAVLAAGGAISGLVTDASGAPLHYARVFVTDATTGDSAGSTVTGSDGRYAVPNLPAGSYHVCFSEGQGASIPGYLEECHNNVAPSATLTPVAVTLGAATTVNATLAPAAGISGKVSTPDGKPLTLAMVAVYDAAEQWVGDAGVAPDGYWDIGQLAPGTYTVCVNMTNAWHPPGYLSECYVDKTWNGSTPLPTGTTPVTTTAGSFRTGINFVLAEKPSVMGRVTSTAAAALAGVRVHVFTSDDSAEFVGTTSSTGDYLVPVNAAGSYRVCFDGSQATGGPSLAGYLSECHSNIPITPNTMWTAPTGYTVVSVPASGRVTVNADLAPAGGFTGTITSSVAGYTVSGVWASASDGSGAGASVSAQGNTYTLGGLATGTYNVCFSGGASNGVPIGGFAYQCYTVSTTAGAAPTVRHATLTPPGGRTPAP